MINKHTYQLIINQGKAVPKPCVASFGNNHKINLHIRSTGILISTVTSAEKDPEEIMFGRDPLFADALKKALLLYVIRFNRYISITTASVMINNTVRASYSLKNERYPLIYSLSEGRLREDFSPEWGKQNVRETITHTSGSRYDGRFTALHALLTAKSDRYEIERFTYYWMAMNGLYNYISAEGDRLIKSRGIKSILDTEQQKQAFMLKCLGYDEPVCPSGSDKHAKNLHSKRILWPLIPIIRTIPEEDIEDFYRACVASDKANRYTQQITAAIDRMNIKYDYHEQYDLFPLIVVWMPYKLRCGSFHGESALPTFCYSDDSIVRTLRVINRILDRFLTDQLPVWLASDEKTIEDRKARICKAADDPDFQKKKKN